MDSPTINFRKAVRFSGSPIQIQRAKLGVPETLRSPLLKRDGTRFVPSGRTTTLEQPHRLYRAYPRSYWERLYAEAAPKPTVCEEQDLVALAQSHQTHVREMPAHHRFILQKIWERYALVKTWPSAEQLAKQMNLNQKAADDLVSTLLKTGALQMVPLPDKSQNTFIMPTVDAIGLPLLDEERNYVNRCATATWQINRYLSSRSAPKEPIPLSEIAQRVMSHLEEIFALHESPPSIAEIAGVEKIGLAHRGNMAALLYRLAEQGYIQLVADPMPTSLRICVILRQDRQGQKLSSNQLAEQITALADHRNWLNHLGPLAHQIFAYINDAGYPLSIAEIRKQLSHLGLRPSRIQESLDRLEEVNLITQNQEDYEINQTPSWHTQFDKQSAETILSALDISKTAPKSGRENQGIKRIIAALKQHSDNHLPPPSLAALAVELGVSVAAVSKQLQELDSLGWVKMTDDPLPTSALKFPILLRENETQYVPLNQINEQLDSLNHPNRWLDVLRGRQKPVFLAMLALAKMKIQFSYSALYSKLEDIPEQTINDVCQKLQDYGIIRIGKQRRAKGNHRIKITFLLNPEVVLTE